LPYGETESSQEKKDFDEEWEFPNISTKEQRRWYTEETISHPAKCSVPLVRKIIKMFTKPSEQIRITEDMLKELDKRINWCNCKRR